MKKRLLFLGLWVCLNLASANGQQAPLSLNKRDLTTVVDVVKKNLEYGYIENLKLIRRQSNDPESYGTAQFYVGALVEQCFAKDGNTQVYNDLEPLQASRKRTFPTYLEISGYCSSLMKWYIPNTFECRFNFKSAYFSNVQYTANKQPFLNVYVWKSINGQTTPKPFGGVFRRDSSLLEIKYTFLKLEKRDKGLFISGARILGIRQMEMLPDSRSLNRMADLQKQAEQEELLEAELNYALGNLQKKLIENLSKSLRQLKINKFSYKNQGVFNQFSNDIQYFLQSSLKDQLPAKILDAMEELPAADNLKRNEACLINGFYEEEKDYLIFRVTAKDAKTGKELAQAESKLALTYFADKTYKPVPDNFETAVKTQTALSQNEIPFSTDLIVELTTNKGNENLTFVEGQKLIVQVKANRPCWVRLIYHQADGAIAFLWKEYEIRPQQVGRFISLEVGECAAPFGQEILQLNASDKPFTLLKTRVVDGREIITNRIEEINQSNRSNGKLRAEKRLKFSTIPRTRA